MKKVLNVLTSWYFLGSVALLATLTLVYLLGRWMEWSMTVQLIAVVGVLLVATIILLVAFARASSKAAEIEESIAQSADDQRAQSRADQRPEVEELKQDLTNAINTLKTSKLGRGGRGNAALYALPWYMFIGPPGAGKTIAISNSGLNFPLGVDRVKGVGGTRNCDWFFSDQAILLDTAGRYMTEQEDTEEWHAFLDMLKENRSSRPINGAIVGIPVQELVEKPREKVEWHANRIRRRIDELVERLGVRFPVYIVFTKCDLMRGFVEFFDDLTDEERDQVWGYTMTREDREEGEVPKVFSEQFDRLVERLTSRRSHRLSRPMSNEKREHTYVFPLEFAAVKDRLEMFVEKLFQPNPFQENPICRGFYFTSGTQEGVPADYVTGAVAGDLALPGNTPEPYDPERDTKAFFIKDLFTDVVVPDRYIVQRTSKASRKTWLTQAAYAAAALFAIGLFSYGAYGALQESQSEVSSVRESAVTVRTASWTGGADPSSFASLDELRAKVASLEQYRDNPPWLRWGLKRGDTVLEPARGVYMQSMRSFVKNDPLQMVKRRMRAATEKDVLRRDERDALYADLKAYMLLTTEVDRLQNEVERDFLAEYLPQTAQTVQQAPETERDALTQQVRTQVDVFAEAVAEGRVEPYAGDRSLIDEVRTLVYEPPSIDRLYQQIKEEGNARITKMTLGEILEGRYMELFEGRPEVPGFFTRGGYDSYVKDAIEQETALPDEIDWVMGYSKDDIPESMKNQEKVAEELKTLYYAEYAAAWNQFLGQLRLTDFNSIRDAARSLNDLGNAYDSPLIYVLGTASYQTTLGSSAMDEVKDRAEEVGKRAAERQTRRLFGRSGRLDDGNGEREEAHPVDRQFKWLHDLKIEQARSGNASPAIMDALESMSEVSSVLDGLAGDDAKASTYAQTVLQTGNGSELEGAYDAIQDALRRFDQSTRARLFDAPIIDAWREVAASAQRHVNRLWRRDVCRPFASRLAGRYPFDMDSPRDVPVSDFEQFFKPMEGTLATFRANTLDPFMERDGTQPRTWQRVGIGLSPEAQRAIDRAETIGERVFDGSVVKVAFDLQPEQPETDPGAPATSRVFLEAHGSTLTYDMGNYRPWTTFNWPGGPDAVLRVTTMQGELEARRARGPWAFFRLLQEADVQRKTPTTYVVRWPMERGITATFVLRTDDSDAPYNDLSRFFAFTCPDSLN